jgi:c-di-GMP-binding flagellar brake protein YcgR
MSFQYVPLGVQVGPPKCLYSNRRGAVRYQCAPATPGQVQLGGEEWQRAWVLDLSLGGIGLLLSRAIEPGTQIVVHLKNATRDKVYQLTARICHATRQPDGDWILGCEFIEKLTDDQMDALL